MQLQNSKTRALVINFTSARHRAFNASSKRLIAKANELQFEAQRISSCVLSLNSYIPQTHLLAQLKKSKQLFKKEVHAALFIPIKNFSLACAIIFILLSLRCSLAVDSNNIETHRYFIFYPSSHARESDFFLN